MSDRDSAMDKVARDYMNAARKSGNSDYTFDQARRRVATAVRRGDAKRDNGNR